MLDMLTIDHHTSLDASDSGIRHFVQGIHSQKGDSISEMILDHECLLRGSSSAKPMSQRAAASSHKKCAPPQQAQQISRLLIHGLQ